MFYGNSKGIEDTIVSAFSRPPRYDRFDNSPNIDFRKFVCVPSCGARKNRRIRWCLIFSTAAPRNPRFIRPGGASAFVPVMTASITLQI